MKIITEHTEQAWRAEVKDGPSRPVVRATIQLLTPRKRWYNTEDAPGGDYDHHRNRKGRFLNYVMGSDAGIREIRNIDSYSWSRSVDQDVAECTLEVLNTDVTPMGNEDEIDPEGFERPGMFTFSRNPRTVYPNPWDYGGDTGWDEMLVPDRMVKTYEGYGSDDSLPPGDDPKLYMSGTWVIDEVDYTADGNITLSMRDLGRLLIEHIVFPPMVPYDDYPMVWSKIETEEVETRVPTGGDWGLPAARATSSNNLYIGEGLTDKPKYVGTGGSVQGHQNSDPIAEGAPDGNFWISTGQESYDSFVWWEQRFDRLQDTNAIRIQTYGGPYKIFISLQRDDGTWYGKREIPYKVTTGDVDLEAGIRFVKADVIDKGDIIDINLPKKYANVRRVRITMTRLRQALGGSYPYRGGLRRVRMYTGAYANLGFGEGTTNKPVGNYRDFTDIVKWVGAWCGWWWPETDQEDYIKYSTTGPKVHYNFSAPDAVLPAGRVWGSFQKTGTAGIADLTADQFDKQPLMDVIAHVKEITGYNFWIDESGGMVWRRPNIYELGNYVTPGHKEPRGIYHVDDIIEIDETETLMDYSTRLSTRNLRERIFVGDSTGKYGAVIRGYNPFHGSGLHRVAGWTDQNFESNAECRVAADMIAARQMFDFRRGNVTIWGNPAIQIDDQIRIRERVTNETFFHYVLGVSCTLSNKTGEWTYELETHWLGERPSDAWVVRVDEMQQVTQNYLALQGGYS